MVGDIVYLVGGECSVEREDELVLRAQAGDVEYLVDKRRYVLSGVIASCRFDLVADVFGVEVVCLKFVEDSLAVGDGCKRVLFGWFKSLGRSSDELFLDIPSWNEFEGLSGW